MGARELLAQWLDLAPSFAACPADVREAIREVLAELKRCKQQPRREIGEPCAKNHSGYWRTFYGACMACRAEVAEQSAQAAEAKASERSDRIRDLLEHETKLANAGLEAAEGKRSAEERERKLREALERLKGLIGALTFVVPPSSEVRLQWHDEAMAIINGEPPTERAKPEPECSCSVLGTCNSCLGLPPAAHGTGEGE